MTRINIFIPDPMLAALKKLAAELDVPVSELIRQAIDTELERREKRKLT